MRTIHRFFLAMASVALLVGSAYGQVRKCTGPDGKVTYSDSICGAGTTKENSVTVNSNTIDSSGLRQQAQKYRDSETMESAANSGQCKFLHYKYGDAQGKLLADAAKQECLENLLAKSKGQQTSSEAYVRWKDHMAMTSARRDAAATRAAIEAVGNTVNNKTYECKPNLTGRALDCR